MGCQDIEPEEPEQDLTSTSFEETSSALNNNPAPWDFQIVKFNEHYITITPSDYDLGEGKRVFTKLASNEGNTILLGEVNRYGQTVLPITAPANEILVRFELFTNSSTSQVNFGEVFLWARYACYAFY